MTYTGSVSPGGPPHVRELAGLTITKMSVGEMDNNTYLPRCQHTDQQLLIDAAAEAPRILELVGRGGLASIVTTHEHWDHVGALAEVREATGARTYAGADDVEGIPVPTGVPLTDGDVLKVGDHMLEVIHLVGHTPGSVALLYDDPAGTPHLWTGDSLFPGGPGRTTRPQDFDTLMGDLQSKVFDRLPDETWFYPGHGKDSTLGAERGSIPEWLERRW